MSPTPLEQGIAALKAGQRDEARKLLAAAIKQDPNNERAWQWLYNAAESDQERLACLRQIVRINPKNQKAALMLLHLSGSTLDKKPAPKKSFARYLLAFAGALVFVCLVIIALLALSPSSDPAGQYVKEYGGDRAAYVKILALEDCQALQKEFETASANNQRAEPGTGAFRWTLGYMTAANARMKEIGCYQQSEIR